MKLCYLQVMLLSLDVYLDELLGRPPTFRPSSGELSCQVQKSISNVCIINVLILVDFLVNCYENKNLVHGAEGHIAD